MPRWKTGWITSLSILNGPFDPNGCYIPSACRIHPFLNGNSRMWGLKIPLSLYPKDILHRPIFYMFATLYAERLNAIHKENKWNGWISFFLPATLEQARSNISRVQKINKLYGELKVAFGNVTKRESKYSYLLLYCILRCLSFLHFKSAETCWRGNPTFWLREFTILEQSHQGRMGQFTQKRKRKKE